MRFPLVAPLGNHIPLRSQIPGRAFRQGPQPETASHFSAENWDAVSTEPQRETASHSKGKFRDAASATPPIRKSHPTPHTSGHRTISLLGLPSIKGRPRVMKKPRESRGFHVCTIERAAPQAAKLFAQNGLFAAAAMLSISSLVGWSFAATQLSSSILNRALSGSCSSIAS